MILPARSFPFIHTIVIQAKIEVAKLHLDTRLGLEPEAEKPSHNTSAQASHQTNNSSAADQSPKVKETVRDYGVVYEEITPVQSSQHSSERVNSSDTAGLTQSELSALEDMILPTNISDVSTTPYGLITPNTPPPSPLVDEEVITSISSNQSYSSAPKQSITVRQSWRDQVGKMVMKDRL